MMQIFMIGTTLVCSFLVATIIYRRKMLMSVKKCFTALFFFFFSAIVTAQVQSPESKIDPAFRFLISNIAKLKDSAAFSNFPQLFKLKSSMVIIPGKQALEERYDCIIYTTLNPQALREKGIVVQAILPKFVTAWVTIEQIQLLATLPEVQMVEAPRSNEANNDVAVAGTGASLLHAGRLNNTPYKGKGVIAAIFDSGIDWDHLDFRDPTDTTKSRILRIWDQTLSAVAGELAPTAMGFNYGVEYTREQINNELDGTPVGFVRELDINGHGTHVAGTFAGNGAAIPLTRKHTGMAPEADIVIIKGGNGSYSNTNIINAISYLQALANQLGKPVVLNMSIGTTYGPHDGSLSYETAIDNFTASGPGRAVVIAAGNGNGTRSHNRLLIGPAGIGNVTFTVPAGTSGTDVFAYRLYVNDNSTLTATLTAPDGTVVTALPNQTITGVSVAAGFNINLYNYVDIADNDRYVEVYVTRNGNNTASPVGIWTLGLINTTGNPLTLDGWLYYTSSEFAGTLLGNSDNEYMTSSPSNATSAISVTAFVGRPAWYSYGAAGNYFNTSARQDSIATFSSHGPRRDEVLKPEVAANGQHVISALSSNSTPEISDIVNNSYVKNQGTSMSSPVVAGAVVLMLQANPTATVAQLRNAIFTNTTKDAITEGVTGATPNPIWGYGRLDVYKAVSAMFNCTPVNRKTFQHDASNFPSQDAGVTQTITRVCVRFTPDITGKLGGAYFHTSGAKTALVMEVRTSNAGAPGTLLGTMNLPDTTIGLYSWNYVDLSSLNVSVTSGNDYFVIVYRDATSNANWSLRRENTNVDNRSLISTDGATWSNPGVDYKIRSVVYSNVQITGPVATTNSTNTRDINTSNQFINSNCQLIAQLVPAGATPVSGTVAANVWIEPGIPRILGGGPFVARHYQLTPSMATGTGRVTLYFTQDDFTAFNNDIASTSDLPTGPTDVVGKANLLIGKFSGSSGDGSGLPNTYSGSATIIDPNDADIVWNTDANRWEVTFEASNLGGLIVQTRTTVLPIIIDYFTGKKENSANVLDWKVACGSSSTTRFVVERSAAGAVYSAIGSLSAAQARCAQPFSFTDNSPVSGANYYRIKITEANGNVYYTNVVLLQSDRALTNGLYPTYLVKGAAVQVSFAGTSGILVVNDATGKQVYSHTLRTGVQSISIPAQASGMYFYKLIENNKTVVAGGKLVVQ